MSRQVQICVLGIKPRDCSKNGDQWRRPVILVEEVNKKKVKSTERGESSTSKGKSI